jgi:nitrite reductase/ring-hydroxylating ferredoxin subunit
MKYPLISIDNIPTTGSQIVDFFGRTAHVYLRDGKPAAVANICMHFGGPLEFNAGENTFTCPWHGAAFDSDGRCITGPAPSNARLMFISTRVEDGTLYYVWGE